MKKLYALCFVLFSVTECIIEKTLNVSVDDRVEFSFDSNHWVISYTISPSKNFIEYVPSSHKGVYVFAIKKPGVGTITFSQRHKISQVLKKITYKIHAQGVTISPNAFMETLEIIHLIVQLRVFLNDTYQLLEKAEKHHIPLSPEQREYCLQQVEYYRSHIPQEYLRSSNLDSMLQELKKRLLSQASNFQEGNSPYAILNVKPTDSLKKIAKEYRKLATQWHPDKFVSKSPDEQKKAQEMMLKINGAYETICKLKSS